MFTTEIKSRLREDICILVKLANHSWNYICECGDASDLTVKEVQNTNAIFISHTHIDHFVNFDAMIRHQIGIQRRVVVCGPQGIARQVQAKLHSYTWNLIEKDAIVYEIREVESEGKVIIYELEPPQWDLKEIAKVEGKVVFEEKAFNVTYTMLDHKVPTLAFRFKEHDSVRIDLQESEFQGGKWVQELKQAYEQNLPDKPILIKEQAYKASNLFHLLHIKKGDSIGVIMDHAASPENHTKITAHFQKCRKVFIESFYKAADKEQAMLNFHSFSTKSGEVMKEAQVKEAVPVHFSRKYSQTEIEELIQEFEQALKKVD